MKFKCFHNWGIQNDGLPQGSLRFQRSGSNGKMLGVFRTADLGQQYDTVSRVGGNFSFCIDTLILLCITFGVICSLSSQVGLLWFIPPRGILLCVGPYPALLLVH
jgi:hypothetical protein